MFISCAVCFASSSLVWAAALCTAECFASQAGTSRFRLIGQPPSMRYHDSFASHTAGNISHRGHLEMSGYPYTEDPIISSNTIRWHRIPKRDFSTGALSCCTAAFGSTQHIRTIFGTFHKSTAWPFLLSLYIISPTSPCAVTPPLTLLYRLP